MAIKFTIPSIDGLTLKTRKKYVPDNIRLDVGIPRYDYSTEGGITQINSLKRLMDLRKSADYLFNKYSGESVDDLIGYSDTENITSAKYMFSFSNVKSVPSLNLSKATDISEMFGDCKMLEHVGAIDTSSVYGNGMVELFHNCISLKEIPEINTSAVSSLSYTFSNCQSIIRLPELDTSNVITMTRTFDNCRHLLSVSRLATNLTTGMAYTFNNCYEIKLIDISHYNISSGSNASNTFANCHSLRALVIRHFGESYVADVSTFNACYRILGIQDDAHNPNGLQDGFIYIPRDMISTISSATNWSVVATQLRAIEDYTTDGTVDGDLRLSNMGLEELDNG